MFALREIIDALDRRGPQIQRADDGGYDEDLVEAILTDDAGA
jgi:hypothetical protein